MCFPLDEQVFDAVMTTSRAYASSHGLLTLENTRISIEHHYFIGVYLETKQQCLRHATLSH